jgi:DNA-binding CsgD family transcriptional regulator
MCSKTISEALHISTPHLKKTINQLQEELESVAHCFHALFWLYTHDFLWISENISKVTGHPFPIFQNHGMVFFQSIIPPHRIEHIYKTMNAQAAAVEQHPEYLMANEFLNVEAAVLNVNHEEIPVSYNALILDTKTFEPPSYLVLCSWIAGEQLSAEAFNNTEQRLKSILIDIKNCYFKAHSARINFLMAGKKLTDREKEIAELLAKGLSTKNIGEQLCISFNTVESHRKNLLQKLEAKNTAELIYKFNKV